MQPQRFSLRFKNAEAPDPAEIAEFLFLFRATYAAALHVAKNNKATTSESILELSRKTREYIGSLDVKKLDSLFYRGLGEQQIRVDRISQESPLEIVLECIVPGAFVVALLISAAAGVISGGKFRAGLLNAAFFEADLKPLGEGIKKLRDALAKPTKSRIAFGVRSRRVKLSKEERDELKRVPRSQRSHGGFQRRLVSFQDRIDQKGELELGESDIDFIVRHARHSHKGGFQARIRKIFGRHFDFDNDASHSS